MRLVACIYLDHQEVMNYPLGYVLESLDWVDAIYLYGSDDGNTAFLEDLKLKHRMGPKLVVQNMNLRMADDPSVWPYATNRMIDLTIASDPFDFLVVAGCDTLATDESIEMCLEFCRPDNREDALHLHTTDATLYMQRGGGNGHSILGRCFTGRIGVRRHFERGIQLENTDRTRYVFRCIHIGYLGLELCANHLRQAARTWNDANNKNLADLYDSGDIESFVRGTVARRVPRGWPPIEEVDPRYTKVIDDLGLREECTQIVELIRSPSGERRPKKLPSRRSKTSTPVDVQVVPRPQSDPGIKSIVAQSSPKGGGLRGKLRSRPTGRGSRGVVQ